MAARIERDPVPVALSPDSLFTMFSLPPFHGSGLHPEGDRWIVAQNLDTTESVAPEPDRLILVQNFFEELTSPLRRPRERSTSTAGSEPVGPSCSRTPRTSPLCAPRS